MFNEIQAFENHYQRCSDKAKEYFNNVVLPAALNFKDRNALTILYAGCGVAPASCHLLNCLIAKDFVGKIKLILVDTNRKALDFALRKLQSYRSDKLTLNIESICSEIKYYATTTRELFDIILFEHPLSDLLGNLMAPLLYKIFPGIMYYLMGEGSMDGNTYRQAILLLSKKIKPQGIVMGGCYTIVEHQQLTALLGIASEFKIIHSSLSMNSLFCLPIAEYSTSLLAKKTDTTSLGKLPNERLLTHMNQRDKMFLLSFLFCNILLFTVDKFASLNETLKFAAVAMLGFYIQPILHNYSRNDWLNKIIVPLLETAICFLPTVLWPQEKASTEVFDTTAPFRSRL